MAATESIKVQAKTLEKALVSAAHQLGTDVESLSHKIISQTDGGFLSFLGSKRVEIEAWSTVTHRGNSRNGNSRGNSRGNDRGNSRGNSRSGNSRGNSRGNSNRHSAPARRPSPESTLPKVALTDEEMTNLVEDLRQFCAGICGFIAGGEVEVIATLEGERLVLDINDEDVGAQIARNSKIAESMEHILRKKPRYLKRELPFRIFVDVNGQRLVREDELINMAQDLSIKVHEDQKPIVLNYKSSYDRKIIHMALDKDDRVYTKSIGSGTNRKLMILPIKGDEGHEMHEQ